MWNPNCYILPFRAFRLEFWMLDSCVNHPNDESNVKDALWRLGQIKGFCYNVTKRNFVEMCCAACNSQFVLQKVTDKMCMFVFFFRICGTAKYFLHILSLNCFFFVFGCLTYTANCVAIYIRSLADCLRVIQSISLPSCVYWSASRLLAPQSRWLPWRRPCRDSLFLWVIFTSKIKCFMPLNSNSGILILMSVNQSQNLGKHKTPHG